MIGTAKTESDREAQIKAVLTDYDERVVAVRAAPPQSPRILAAFDRAAAAVDRAKAGELQAYVRSELPEIAKKIAFKYLDVPAYLKDKSSWAVEVGLDEAAPLRMLDLGVGGGHFPFVAKVHGHEVLGIDMDDPLYTRLLAVYGVPRIVHTIKPFTPLPVDGVFNLVTALQTTFNRKPRVVSDDPTELFWTTEEWAWFFGDLCSRLVYPGRIFFGLNRQPIAGGYNEADRLMPLFERNGATVDRRRNSVLFELDGPLKLRD